MYVKPIDLNCSHKRSRVLNKNSQVKCKCTCPRYFWSQRSIFQQTRNIADTLQRIYLPKVPSLLTPFCLSRTNLDLFGFASSFFFAKDFIGNKFSLSCLSCLTFFRLFNISFLSYLFNFSSYFSSSTFSLCLFFCLLSLSRQRTLWQWTEISCTEFINMINDIDEMFWNTFNASSDFSDSMILFCHKRHLYIETRICYIQEVH